MYGIYVTYHRGVFVVRFDGWVSSKTSIAERASEGSTFFIQKFYVPEGAEGHKHSVRMAKFKRIFHPVGHGAFFTEQFYDDYGNLLFNVVYDCGTKTSNVNTDTLFTNTFPKGSHIDILFISHFDDDHISGIEKNIELPKKQ